MPADDLAATEINELEHPYGYSSPVSRFQYQTN